MRTCLLLLVLASPLLAQEQRDAHLRAAIGFAGGNFDFDTDGSALEDDTEAAMFRLQFEGNMPSGIGGGLRLEALATDDDLFAGTGFPVSEATNTSIFGHFTYRFEEHRFAMPLRIGLLVNNLRLLENVSDDDVNYTSLGPYFEIAPEVTLAGRRNVQWSLYSELGIGVGGTWIDIDGDSNEYESATGFFGVEAGTRFRFNMVEVGIAYIGRWQSMDESDEENGFVAFGYDAQFQGLMLTFGVVF